MELCEEGTILFRGPVAVENLIAAHKHAPAMIFYEVFLDHHHTCSFDRSCTFSVDIPNYLTPS